MGKLKIDEVINEVLRVRHKYMVNNNGKVPSIHVYMDYQYWVDCKTEVKGAVDACQYEFMSEGTIMGYPVWRVVATYNGGTFKKHHAPFSIFIGDE